MRRAFTLIELLVVIAIISILAAILVPVFVQAKRTAKQIVCVVHVRQVGMAMMMYRSDYDEVWPSAVYAESSPGWAPQTFWLGYDNNNCVGCVQGGMGYWNKVRVDFPETFDRMAKLERRLGNTVLRDNGEALYLDELDPHRGNASDEPDIECSLLCALAEEDL